VPEWFNISALAERTGVAAHTLRKWEERYGVLVPARTPGGQRRYSDVDVARIEWLRDRLHEGYRIGEAAALLGAAGTAPPRTPRALCDALVEAMLGPDADAVERLLDHAFAVYPLERVLREVVTPLFARVGHAWEAGEASIAQEHLVSSAVRARVDRLLTDARAGVRGRAVLACAPGERHELGLLILAVLMRGDGWSVAYLGPETPFADAVRLSERIQADVLCISVARAEPASELVAAARSAGARRNGPPLVLGGAAATPLVAERVGATPLGPELDGALASLRELGS
jgi:MerR family transcriptional regulator, light-induced transcriptional regulator